MWRNQKISSATKIYRFFIMDAVVRHVIGDRSFLKLSNKQKIKAAEEIIKLAADEEQLGNVVQLVEKVLNKRLKALNALTARERLRDVIRSDSFFQAARPDYMPKSPILS